MPELFSLSYYEFQLLLTYLGSAECWTNSISFPIPNVLYIISNNHKNKFPIFLLSVTINRQKYHRF